MHLFTEVYETLVTRILIFHLVLALAACGGGGSLSPTMSVAGTYAGPLEVSAMAMTSSGKGVSVIVTYSLRLTVAQSGAQLTITGFITPPADWNPNEAEQVPAIIRTINADGSVMKTSGGIFTAAMGLWNAWEGIHLRGFLSCPPATTTSATLTFSENTMQVLETLTTASCGDMTISGTLILES